MSFKNIGWAMFCGEAASYSEAFQKQMSEQLYVKFCLHLQKLTAKETDKFFLHVGMTEMQTTSSNCYAFAHVEIISPNSLATTVTAYWKTIDENNILQAVNDSTLNRDSIDFGWCSDFKKEDFLKPFKRKKNLSRKKHNLNFDVECD